jgi:hypothetical protein
MDMATTRGRPRNTFLTDPDRYVLALASVFREMGTSRRGAIEIAVAALEGFPSAINSKPGWGRGLGLLDVHYELRDQPDDPDAIANRARWLRRKIKDGVNDEASRRWLAAMSGAWLIAPRRGPPRIIIDLASSVGEAEYANAVLIPVANGGGAQWQSKKMRKKVRQQIFAPRLAKRTML